MPVQSAPIVDLETPVFNNLTSAIRALAMDLSLIHISEPTRPY